MWISCSNSRLGRETQTKNTLRHHFPLPGREEKGPAELAAWRGCGQQVTHATERGQRVKPTSYKWKPMSRESADRHPPLPWNDGWTRLFPAALFVNTKDWKTTEAPITMGLVKWIQYSEATEYSAAIKKEWEGSSHASTDPPLRYKKQGIDMDGSVYAISIVFSKTGQCAKWLACQPAH